MKSDELNSLMDAPVRVRGRLFEDYEVGQEFKYHLDLFWTRADYWKDEAKRGGRDRVVAAA